MDTCVVCFLSMAINILKMCHTILISFKSDTVAKLEIFYQSREFLLGILKGFCGKSFNIKLFFKKVMS